MKRLGLDSALLWITLATLVVLAIASAGCSGLILRPNDSVPATGGKVLARVILAPLTLGISEMHIDFLDFSEKCDAGRCPISREAAALAIGAGALQPIQSPPLIVPAYGTGQRAVVCTTTEYGFQRQTVCQ